MEVVAGSLHGHVVASSWLGPLQGAGVSEEDRHEQRLEAGLALQRDGACVVERPVSVEEAGGEGLVPAEAFVEVESAIRGGVAGVLQHLGHRGGRHVEHALTPAAGAEAAAIIKKHGYSTREFFVASTTFGLASMAVSLKKSGMSAAAGSEPSSEGPVVKANEDLIEKNWEEIQKLSAAMRSSKKK